MKKELEIRGDELYLSIVGSSSAMTAVGLLFAIPGFLICLFGSASALFGQDSMAIADAFKAFFIGGLLSL